jgi:hypothetical protein
MGEFVSDRAATTDPVPGSERGHPPSESSSSLQPIRRIGDPPWATVGLDARVGPDDYPCVMVASLGFALAAAELQATAWALPGAVAPFHRRAAA